MMLLFLTTIASANAEEDLAPQIKYWTNQVNSQVIVASQETEIFTKLQQTLKENPTLPAIPEVIPKIGDFNFELERLKGKHNLGCVLFLKYDGSKKITIQDFGECSPSKDLHFTIDEFQGKWDVYDQSNNIVPVDSFARVCNDYTLQARLEQEDRYLKRNTKILRWSAGTLALASFIPLRNESIGFTAREEARVWSFVFLMGSASVLYFSRNIPTQKVQEEQSTLRNYYSKTEVERILAQRFPPPPEEEPPAEELKDPQDDSEDKSEDKSEEDDGAQNEETPVEEDDALDDLPDGEESNSIEEIETEEVDAETQEDEDPKENPKQDDSSEDSPKEETEQPKQEDEQ